MSIRGSIGIYACDHCKGYNNDVAASAAIVNKLYCDDINNICLSVTINANKCSIFSGDKHSKRGYNGIPDHTLGSLDGGHRKDIA